MLVGSFSSETVTWERSFPFTWELSLGIFRLATSAWDLLVGTKELSLKTFTLDLSFWALGLGAVVCDFHLGTVA